MSQPTSKIECRWCGQLRTLHRLRREHGERNPYCVGIRTYAMMEERGLTNAGKYQIALELAGVVKHVPMYLWWSDPVYGEPDEDGHCRVASWARTDLVSYEPVAPKWAVRLAHQLSESQAVIRRIGGYRREKRDKLGMWARRQTAAGEVVEMADKNHVYKLMLPLEVRAAVIRTAAGNAMAREMIDDDLEAALRIIRDVG